ncbi:hypothetical protein C1646_754720 [Rhizophagus diaphanus]|nr:hypothetical protein C1646_754720 [Rhizophagus diaphanus] [Rhizophagus sp. MUCL 43196]
MSFGLFLNKYNSKLMIILLYICFITIFLPQLSLSEQQKLSVSLMNDNDLKIIQGTSFQNGTILLRLIKLEQQALCKNQNLSFIIILDPMEWSSKNELDKTNKTTNAIQIGIEHHSIPDDNFCSTSTVTTNPNPNPSTCTENPYGFGCNVKCNNDTGIMQPPGCRNLPTTLDLLNCTIYPTAPNCIPKSVLLDCAKYPRAEGCIPDCPNKPYLPGCNDCAYYPDASGCKKYCDPIQQDQTHERCQSGYCDNNPDAPECSLIKMDKIKIQAIDGTERIDGTKEQLILATYYCNPLINDDACGSLFNLEGKEIRKFNNFNCSEGSSESSKSKIFKYLYDFGFLCYVLEGEVSYLNLTLINDNGSSEYKDRTTKVMDTVSVNLFNSYHTNVFTTEDGYAIVTSSIAENSNVTIFTTFIHKDKTIRGPFLIYQNGGIIGLRIYVCNIAYQSSGYSCIIQTTDRNYQVTYEEVDFLSNGNLGIVKVINLNLMINNIITDVQPLNFGGYVFKTINRNSGNVDGYVTNNEGKNIDHISIWDTMIKSYIYSSFVLPNNTIMAIPEDSSIFNKNKSIEEGLGVPGGPGGYGSSKIISTTPSKYETIPLSKAFREFTITYNIPIVASTGKFSVFQVNNATENVVQVNNAKGKIGVFQVNNATIKYGIIHSNFDYTSIIGDYIGYGNYTILKQTIAANNNRFVTIENDTVVKLRVLDVTLSTIGASYYVTIDNDFVKEKSNGQNVIGIRKNIWKFDIHSDSSLISSPSGSAIIRLTPEGTKHYLNLTSNDKSEFVNSMANQLSMALSCEYACLNITKNFQYDVLKKNAQIIMRVDINFAYYYRSDELPKQLSKVSSEKLLQGLSEIVVYKELNSLAIGENTTYIDALYGAPQTERLWDKYWGFLLATVILSIILIFLIFKVRKIKDKDDREGGKNEKEQEGLSIFFFVLILIDLSLDIAFIYFHKNDYKWVLSVTIFFLIFPLVLNLVFTKCLTERRNKIILFLSFLDMDALQDVLSRKVKPFTDEEISLLIKTGVVVLFEEIPQLIIYIVYYKLHIKPAIVPILVLSSCSTQNKINSGLYVDGLFVFVVHVKKLYLHESLPSL